MRKAILWSAVVALSAAAVTLALAADKATKFELTVDSIMRGPRLVGYPPSGLRWSGDSRQLFFEWRKPGEDEAATYVTGRDGGEPRRLSDEERKLAPPAGGVWDRARRRVLFVDEGDVVLFDSVARTRRQITKTTGSEGNPRWARGESHVTFTRESNLFIVPADSVSDALLVQLTDVSPPKKEPKLTESQKFLKEEELKLIDHVKEAAEKRKKDEDKRKKNAPPKFDLLERQSASDLALSPDGEHVFLIVSERAGEAKTAAVPNYVTETAYTEDIQARIKVGDAQDKRRLAVLNLKTGKTVWAESKFAGTAAPALAASGGRPAGADGQEPVAKPDPHAGAGRKPADREVRWSMPVLSKDGRHAVASARATDNKDRWLARVDPESGATQVVEHLHDDAWVREAGGFGDAPLGFLEDDARLWFLSERDGWMHLYTVDVSREGSEARQLTAGRFEITSAELSPDRRKFYLTSTEPHAGERHLYSVPVDGGERTRLTSTAGSNNAEVAPDEQVLGIVHSYSNKPPEVHVMPNRTAALMQKVTTTPTEEWRSFRWVEPKLVSVKARDGVLVPARLYRPEMLGASPDPARPGVVFVHGAGYLQNAHRYWSSYYREYMFHHLLASKGYVVLDVDYRGSAGYGRDWRTAIYRHMGGKDLDDIVDGAKHLAEKEGVHPKRIGVYGGSYGGFITLMAMFTSPDTFAAGAALRPVTDWAHYNHSYTSSILNAPQGDAEAYRRSSPIYFAEGLKGALLICHGMVDTNVHYQDSVRLAQRLIELRKDNWELASYPVENHGFEEETSWADEYRRIQRLFDDNLRRKR